MDSCYYLRRKEERREEKRRWVGSDRRKKKEGRVRWWRGKVGTGRLAGCSKWDGERFSVRWSGTGSNSWTNEPTDRMAGACSQIDARGSSWAPLFVHLLLHTPLYSLLTLLILPHYTIPRSRIQNQGCVTSSFLPPAFTSPNLPFFLFFSFLLLFYIFFPLSLSLSLSRIFSSRYDTIRFHHIMHDGR